jgi:hypothetical protein
MQVVGSYGEQGYALVEQLIAPEVARAFMAQLKSDLGPAALPVSGIDQFPNLLARPAFEIYGHHYPPMLFFLWGLTPVVQEIVGKHLLPTYDYLRIYREGDVCRVHYDRPSCEHSLSLTLDYSDGVEWPLEVGQDQAAPSSSVAPDFGAERYASLAMKVGDAVLYNGVNHRHGRLQHNPNAWSVHLFLHWVDRDGPYADHAFDRRGVPEKVSFQFA